MAEIYVPRGPAREYSPLAMNYFNGCDLGCNTCYVPVMKKMWGAKNYIHSNVSMKNEKVLLKEIEESCKKHKNSKQQVFLSFLTDAYTHFNDKTKTTRKVLELLLHYNIPVSILSKAGNRILQDLDIFKQFGDNIQIGGSLTFINPGDSFKWERGAAFPDERFEALKTLHDAGIRTWASMEPVYDADQSLAIMETTYPYVDAYKIGKLNYYPKLEVKVNWKKFLTNSVTVMRKYDKAFYIKKDLRRYKDPDLTLYPHEIDMDFLAIKNSKP